VGLVGIADVELKWDSRTDEFKMIEINPRCPTWISAPLASGVNLPYAAYQELLGRPAIELGPQVDGEGVWIDAVRDVLYFLRYRTGDHEGKKLGLRNYLGSLRGRREWAYSAVADPLPGVKRLWDVLAMVVGDGARASLSALHRWVRGGRT